MEGAHAFLQALVIVLGVAALTTVAFERLKQPVVLGYLLAGLIVGPHVPVPLVADLEIVQTLSELCVILLMFALGLEFSLRRLLRVGPTAGTTALVQSSIMVWLGFVTGRAFGWTVRESVFAGAIVAMSSTTIIAKAFDDLRVGGHLRDLVVGVLLTEDLFAVLFMAVLTAVATGAGVSPGELGATLGRLAAFLAVLLAVGMLVLPGPSATCGAWGVRRPCWSPASACASGSRGWRSGPGTRWRWAPSSPARWWPSPARRTRSRSWCGRCGTCSRPSSSSRWACSSSRPWWRATGWRWGPSSRWSVGHSTRSLGLVTWVTVTN